MSTLSMLPPHVRKVARVYESESDWLADGRDMARKSHHIGASTAYRMLTGQFGGLWAVYREHVEGGYEAPDLDDVRIIQVGKRFEPFALEHYADMTQQVVWGSEVMHRIGGEWLWVSPDAWSQDSEGWGLVECKIPTPGQMPHWAPHGTEARAGDLAVPEHYEMQALSQATAATLAGVSVAWVDLWGWWGPHMFRRIRYRFSPDDMRQHFVDVARLRKVHLVDGVRPPIDDSDDCSRHLVRTRDWAAEGVIECDDEWLARLNTLSGVRHRKTKAEAEAAKTHNELRAIWPEGVKSMTVDPGDGSKPGKATMGRNGNITLTRI